ncbi:DUF3800 domain-containing protein [Cellulomonas triticagri]|uniref:DUF3800 domain-containing protein n=1 Tax=Cellulomonas triticagri TaxID=2483352 RepID=UPI0013156741|nr:DUF3800 domain-containing protein [Cellulomonas triticagri]
MPDAQRPTLDRMLYLDDSGSSLSGLVVYGWVEVAPCDWGSALREWLTLRKELVRDYRVPVTAELHCTEYVQGRGVSGFGHISTSPPARFRTTRVSVDGANSEMVLWKDLGREVAERCLTVLARSPTMRVGAVWQRTTAKGSAYAAEKYALYERLISRLDSELRTDGSLGLVAMDGDDPHYRQAHRGLKLATRHLLEDPSYHDSRMSQWTQIADLVAYCAYLAVNRHESQRFGWDWYARFLAPRDVHRGPLHLPEKQLDPPCPRVWGGSAP